MDTYNRIAADFFLGWMRLEDLFDHMLVSEKDKFEEPNENVQLVKTSS